MLTSLWFFPLLWHVPMLCALVYFGRSDASTIYSVIVLAIIFWIVDRKLNELLMRKLLLKQTDEAQTRLLEEKALHRKTKVCLRRLEDENRFLASVRTAIPPRSFESSEKQPLKNTYPFE